MNTASGKTIDLLRALVAILSEGTFQIRGMFLASEWSGGPLEGLKEKNLPVVYYCFKQACL